MTVTRLWLCSLSFAVVAGCYSAPSLDDTDAAVDAPPDTPSDGPMDGSPDSPADGPIDSPQDATPDGTTCTPTCANGTTLTTCNGNTPVNTTCDYTCSNSPQPHCTEPVFSNNVASGVPMGVGDISLDCGGDTLKFFNDGAITRNGAAYRAGGTGVVAGIGFNLVSGLPVFSFNKLSLTDCAIQDDVNNGIALVSLTSLEFSGVRALFVPPTTASGATIGCGNGGTAIDSGGGGAGAAQTGAMGADTATGGAICAAPFAGPQRGSAGGAGLTDSLASAGKGGGPGGALQLSAKSNIKISASRFSFGGGGGKGATAGAPAGGGGSGGTLLIEANTVDFSANVYANGGGGGGANGLEAADGADGPDQLGPLANGVPYGGVGGSRNGATTYAPTDGLSSSASPSIPSASKIRGGGGGAMGYFRILTNNISLGGANQVSAHYSQAAMPLQ